MSVQTGQIVELLVINLFSLPAAVMGIVLCCGKGSGLIAGYNTSSAAEKAKWDEKALCRGAGALVLSILACVELMLCGAVMGNKGLIWAGGLLTAAVTVIGLICLNKSRRFRRK